MIPTRDILLQRRATLILYLREKASEEDWHGVADAAMDLREVDAKLSVLRATMAEEH